MVSTYADGVSIFVSCHRNIDAVYNVLERYEKFTGVRITMTRLPACRWDLGRASLFQAHSVALTGPFAFQLGKD